MGGLPSSLPTMNSAIYSVSIGGLLGLFLGAEVLGQAPVTPEHGPCVSDQGLLVLAL